MRYNMRVLGAIFLGFPKKSSQGGKNLECPFVSGSDSAVFGTFDVCIDYKPLG